MEYLELIKKHGISAIFLFAILWMNNRLNNVEQRLYDCYEDRAVMRVATNKQNTKDETYFILPEKINIRHTRAKRAI